MILNVAKYVLAILVVFAAGYFTGKGDKETVTQDRVVYRDGETKTVYVDRIVTVTKIVHPDGTTEETTKTEDSNKTVDRNTQSGTSDHSTDSKPVLPRYSVGVLASGSSLTEKPDLGGTVGMRIAGDIWARVGLVPATKTVQLGVELQFQ